MLIIKLFGASLFLFLTGCNSLPTANQQADKLGLGAQNGVHQNTKLDLNLCNTKVSNAPNAIAGRVLRESSRFCVNNRSLLIAPAPEACLTSGYGPRFGKKHQGIDYQARPAGAVIAAASGTIVQKSFRAKDLGNWIVLDHGAGVYSAYGHLSYFNRRLRVGKKVQQGQLLGVMGSTGKAASGVHLHYEVRVGRLTPATSFFSLQSVDPFAFPANCG